MAETYYVGKRNSFVGNGVSYGPDDEIPKSLFKSEADFSALLKKGAITKEAPAKKEKATEAAAKAKAEEKARLKAEAEEKAKAEAAAKAGGNK